MMANRKHLSHVGSQGSRLSILLLRGAVNNAVNAVLDVGHLLQHLVDFGFIELQTHKL